jgi:hypothetical protein
MIQTLRSGGWMLLWLIPYRALYYLLYATCWLVLLRPYDPEHRAGLGYLFWATSVRDAIDRLLPVASVGGGVIGIRCCGGVASRQGLRARASSSKSR